MLSFLFALLMAAFVFSPAAACAQLPGALSSIPGTNPKDALDKVLDQQVGKLLGEELPVTLDAKTAYPTVSESALPGGAFAGKPLQLTRDNLLKSLPPGDYIVSMTFFCTEYGQHQPNNGAPYILGPAQGKLSTPVATLLWRGMIVGKTPQELQMISWAIQSSTPYSKMPPQYQKTIDQLLPDFKSQLDGQGFARITNGYDSIVAGTAAKYNKMGELVGTVGKAASLFGAGKLIPKISPPKIQAPTLDTVLGRLPVPLDRLGRLALDGEKLAKQYSADYVSEEKRQQTVFAGQGTQLPPETGTGNAWSVKVPGRVYMRFVVKGGNLGGNNEMQIRVLPAAPSIASIGNVQARPHFQLAGYQVVAGPTAIPSLLGLFGGVADETLLARCVVAGPGFPECVALSVTIAGLVSYATHVPAQAPIMAPTLRITSPIGNLPVMPSVGKTSPAPASSQTADAERDAQYKRAKTFCDNKPPEGSNECSTLSRYIDHAQMCIDLYSAWDEKWEPGTHDEKIWTWGNRLDTLKREHQTKCTNK